MDLLEQLARNHLVRDVWIGLGCDVEWRVLEHGNVRPEVADQLC